MKVAKLPQTDLKTRSVDATVGDEASRVRRRFELLLDAGVTIFSECSLSAVLQRVVDSAREVVGARYAALGVLAEDGVALAEFITSGMSPAERERIGALPKGQGLLGLVIRDPQPIRAADISSHSQHSGFPLHHPPMKSFLGVPVQGRERVFGNLYLTEKIGAAEFDVEDEAIAVFLAAQAAVAIQNAALHERSEQLLEQVRGAVAQAEEANRAKDQFLAILSHELRTPLSSLLLQVELLRRRKSDGAGIERATDAIERSARMQAHLIDDLLDVSRIVSGKLEIERQPVNVAAVVHEAIDLVSSLAAKQSVALEAVVNDSVPPVWGDPVRLRQVVCNLLINAIKFTPEGGQVWVNVEPASGYAQIRVSDTGIGMQPDLIPHVFDPFMQGPATGTVRGGLGLGLAIVSHLVERHGGTVCAESPGPSKGATFTVRLPLIAPTSDAGVPARSRMRQARDAPIFHGVRILVVEDDVEIREPILEMLEQSGADVRGAASAPEARQVFEEFRPQLLVCDIGLPGDDGYALLRQLRALGAARGGDTPAIALTALAGEENRRQAIAAGFTVHLPKPVEFRLLAEALSSLGRDNR